VLVQTPDAAGGGQVIIQLRGGRVLRLPLSMPPGQLAAIVHAIEGQPANIQGSGDVA
jgi:hypothetical protein